MSESKLAASPEKEMKPMKCTPALGAILADASKHAAKLSPAQRSIDVFAPAPSSAGEARQDRELYDAYLLGCEDECVPEPKTFEQFMAMWRGANGTSQ